MPLNSPTQQKKTPKERGGGTYPSTHNYMIVFPLEKVWHDSHNNTLLKEFHNFQEFNLINKQN